MTQFVIITAHTHTQFPSLCCVLLFGNYIAHDNGPSSTTRSVTYRVCVCVRARAFVSVTHAERLSNNATTDLHCNEFCVLAFGAFGALSIQYIFNMLASFSPIYQNSKLRYGTSIQSRFSPINCCDDIDSGSPVFGCASKTIVVY